MPNCYASEFRLRRRLQRARIAAVLGHLSDQNPERASMTDQPTPDDMANAIRSLSMDAVEKANSGHPGLPMGAADVAVALFTKVMKFDPADPHWPDRDRFVLRPGHGSMLLYSALYLLGYEDMTIDQIKNFRQLDSKTPGHPEHGFAAGVEATTGPSGAGHRQRRRHGDRRGAPCGRVRHRSRRSPHLGAVRRRLPDGGHFAGSDRACRAPQAQAS